MAATQKNERPWYWDAVAAMAFFGQAIFLGKAAARFSPLVGLVFFTINLALGYYFGRSAWRGLTDARDDDR